MEYNRELTRDEVLDIAASNVKEKLENTDDLDAALRTEAEIAWQLSGHEIDETELYEYFEEKYDMPIESRTVYYYDREEAKENFPGLKNWNNNDFETAEYNWKAETGMDLIEPYPDYFLDWCSEYSEK